MSGEIPGVDATGCLIALCAGSSCQPPTPRQQHHIWTGLCAALRRLVGKLPHSVLVTTECLGGCSADDPGVRVAAQIRHSDEPPRLTHNVVRDEADAAVLCGSLLVAAQHHWGPSQS